MIYLAMKRDYFLFSSAAPGPGPASFHNDRLINSYGTTAGTTSGLQPHDYLFRLEILVVDSFWKVCIISVSVCKNREITLKSIVL